MIINHLTVSLAINCGPWYVLESVLAAFIVFIPDKQEWYLLYHCKVISRSFKEYLQRDVIIKQRSWTRTKFKL